MKIREFKYKFLHKISICNTWLTKMKIKDDSKCYRCGDNEETLIHFYWVCPQIKNFLGKIFEKLRGLGFLSSFDICAFLIGQGIEKSEIVLIEIFAIVKYQIYLNKINSKKNIFEQVWKKIEETFKMEEKIAKNKGASEHMKLNFKWKNFLNLWQSQNYI